MEKRRQQNLAGKKTGAIGDILFGNFISVNVFFLFFIIITVKFAVINLTGF